MSKVNTTVEATSHNDIAENAAGISVISAVVGALIYCIAILL